MIVEARESFQLLFSQITFVLRNTNYLISIIKWPPPPPHLPSPSPPPKIVRKSQLYISYMSHLKATYFCIFQNKHVYVFAICYQVSVRQRFKFFHCYVVVINFFRCVETLSYLGITTTIIGETPGHSTDEQEEPIQIWVRCLVDPKNPEKPKAKYDLVTQRTLYAAGFEHNLPKIQSLYVLMTFLVMLCMMLLPVLMLLLSIPSVVHYLIFFFLIGIHSMQG